MKELISLNDLKSQARLHGYKLVKDERYEITDKDVEQYLLDCGFKNPQCGIDALGKLSPIAYFDVLQRVALLKLPAKIHDSEKPWYVISRINGAICPINEKQILSPDMVVLFPTEEQAITVQRMIKEYCKYE